MKVPDLGGVNLASKESPGGTIGVSRGPEPENPAPPAN